MHQGRIASRVIHAALGIISATLLGGAGFGLGCLYAGIASSPPLAVQAANVVPVAVNQGIAPGPLITPGPTITPGMGGPEEPVPAPRPAAGATSQFGPALAMDRPVAGGWVSSHFGRRADPFTGRPAVHRGLDFAGLDNSAILAVAPGVVTWSGRQRGYGNLIEIDHGRGWVTRYGHNASNLVAPGDYVKPGQTIALMGATGRATGTHLHFEVLYRGRHQNPARFVPRDT